MAQLTDRIEELIAPTVESMGFEIVRIQLSGDRRPRLQVMAERKDGKGMRVEDCASVSRAVSAVLDVEDPISGAYTLEVSSPGVDRPLTRPKDFERFAGLLARVELSRPLDGRRRFKGVLMGIEGDEVILEVDGEAVSLPFPDIAKAKLVLTDELLAATEEPELT